MPSPQSHYQALPPIHTSTAGARQSSSSRAMSPSSDMMSPTSTYSQGGRSVASVAEASFFGAIATKVRNARSRSRSRNSASRNRTKSPLVLPPDHFPSSSSRHPTSPTYSSSRPQQPRHCSSASQSSTSSSKSQRSSLHGPQRRSTSGSDMWRGRHSNSWLFNDFSVTDTAKDIFHMGRKP